MIVINSSESKGVCYVETKNLDGETNLKYKQARSECIPKAQSEAEVASNFAGVRIECEQPNNAIYKFEGNLVFPGGATIPLGVDNMLLRGSSLRNTKWVYGIAVFTGMESKVMKNSAKSSQKKSKMELATNWYILTIILLQTTLCVLGALYTSVW